MTIDAVRIGIVGLSQLEVGHILEAQFFARLVGLQYQVLEFPDILFSARVSQGILEGA